MQFDGLDLQNKIFEESLPLPTTDSSQVIGEIRPKMYLNGIWYLKPFSSDFGEEKWRKIVVPDAWDSTQGFHSAWYSRRFFVPKAFKSKKTVVHFDAVRLYASVFLNGEYVGEHAGAYTPFELDLTNLVKAEEINTLNMYVKDETYAVRGDKVVHQISTSSLMRPSENGPEIGRGGIWQDVYLQGYPPLFVEDVYVITSFRNKEITVELTLRNTTNETLEADITNSVLKEPGDTEAVKILSKEKIRVEPLSPKQLICTSKWVVPILWSPDHPNLYYLKTTLNIDGKVMDEKFTRFGFREFWIEGSNFYLNGKKIRLRGESLLGHIENRCMERKDFLKALFQVLKKELNFNSIRIHASIGAPAIFEAADEAGLLLENQSSVWSTGRSWYTRGGQEFLANTIKEFEEWVKRDRNHPSVVIWGTENEMIRMGPEKEVLDWVKKLDDVIRKHDRTRPIQHDGACCTFGLEEHYHVHHEENYVNVLKAWSEKRDKPLINGEWWVGGRSFFGGRRLINGAEFKDVEEYLSVEGKLFKERMDEMRAFGVSGIQPFSWYRSCFLPIFDEPPNLEWEDLTAPGPKLEKAESWFNPGWVKEAPTYRLRESYASYFRLGLSPLFICIEEKAGNCWSGEKLKKTLVVCNDSEDSQDLHVEWCLLQGEKRIQNGEYNVRLGPGEQDKSPISLCIPPVKSITRLTLVAKSSLRGKEVCSDSMPLTVYPRRILNPPQLEGKVALYDPKGSTKIMLTKANVDFTLISDFSKLEGMKTLIIGAASCDEKVETAASAIEQFVKNGGCVVILAQEKLLKWLPFPFGIDDMSHPNSGHHNFDCLGLPIEMKQIYFSRYAPIQTPDHPLLKDIYGDTLSWWRNGGCRVADSILFKPNVSTVLGSFDPALSSILRLGFRHLPDPALSSLSANAEVILGGTRPEYVSLATLYLGKGSYVLCQLKLEENYGAEPEATVILHNILTFADKISSLKEKKVLVAGEETGSFLRSIAHAHIRIAKRAEWKSLKEYDSLIIGSEIREEETDWSAIEKFASEGHIVLVMPRHETPKFLIGKLRIESLSEEVQPKTVHIPVNVRTKVTSGYNSEDFKNWPEMSVDKILKIEEAKEVEPLVYVTRRLDGWRLWGIRGKEGFPLGVALARIHIGEGEIILCQLRLLQKNPSAMFILNMILTQLGVRLSFNASKQTLN